MKAVVADQWGNPPEVLHVRDMPDPVCGPGQVRVRMLASPLNPSDLLSVRGLYGKLPPLPFIPGYEGVGVVEEGRGLLAWRVKGRRVVVLNTSGGNWAEQVVIPARQAIPVPDDLPDDQAATFFVNPATALVMTRYVLRIKRGQWLVQTAAGSALGRMIIRLGKRDEFKTINIVRRREQVEELKNLGADVVLVQGQDDLPTAIREATGGKGAPYAVDAVGGDLTNAVLSALGRNGRMLVYGALAMEPAKIDPRALIVGQKRIEGFWMSEWMRDQGVIRLLLLFRKITALIRQKVIDTNIGEIFPMERIGHAARLAETPGRQGKVLLRIGTR